MNSTIPLISSGTTGPLGVLHLPRLWQKVSLENAGKLNSEYPGIGGGYDQMVLDALGIDREEFLNYIKDNTPSYVETEKWVLDKKGGSLDADAVKKLNDSIAGYNHAEGTRKEILGAAGVADDGTILDAVNLNNMDDWTCFHAEVVKG